MGAPDAAARAQIAGDSFRPCFIGWLDILGDPVRVTTAPYSVAFSGTGDADLDGFTFDAADPTLISISPVQHQEGGAGTVTVALSGLIGVDSDLLNQIGNRANWQGRSARLWCMIYNASLQRVGAVWPYYTGYMTLPRITGDASGQTISLEIESYLAFLTQASGRSYLSQADFDPGDHSAELSIAIANGTNQIAASASAATASGLLGIF